MSLAAFARGIERLLDVLLGCAVAVMVVSMIWQVVGRYVFNKAPGWSEELARYLMLWVTMLGAAAALRGGGHLSVTVLAEAIPPGWRAVLLALRDVVMVAVSGLLVWFGFLFAELNAVQDSAAMEIPMSVPYAALPVGSGLILLMVLVARLLGAPFALESTSHESSF